MENARFNDNNNNNIEDEEAPFEFKNLLSEMFTSFPSQNPSTCLSSPSANSSSSSSQNIISFGNPDSNNFLEDEDYDILMMSSNNISSSTSSVAKRICRSPLQSKEHLLAERKRRERFSQLFALLAKTIPGLKKLDKASILEDAIKYIGQLEERVSALEEVAGTTSTKNTTSYITNLMINESTATPQIQQSLADTNENQNIHDMKVQILDRNVLIGLHCSKQMRSIFTIIAGIMENLHLTIHHIRLAPSNHTTDLHYISILAEIDENVDIKVLDIEKAFELTTPTMTQD